MKLKLKKPVEHGTGNFVSELEFREPIAKDMRAIPMEPKQGDMLDLAATLCGQPPSVMNKLCLQDYANVLELVSTFIVGGQETGESV